MRCGFPQASPGFRVGPQSIFSLKRFAALSAEPLFPTVKTFPHRLAIGQWQAPLYILEEARHALPEKVRERSPCAFPACGGKAVWNTSGQGEPEKEQ